ncbi:MAG: HAMP domain-containing sensor histidine kinase [Anaerolineae bacterium]
MSQSNEHSPRLVLLLTDDSTAWFQEIHVHLTHYDLRVVHTPDEAWQTIHTENPDAIIATPTSTSLTFFDSLQKMPYDFTRPVLVLIASDRNLAKNADLLLPPAPTYFDQLLSAFMALQSENQSLHRQNQVLARENEQIKAELQSNKRSTDEVNLLKNAIVRNVSHELKTPLLQVKSAVALLAEDARDNRLSDYATSATSRLEGVVKNISQLADSLDLSMDPVLIRETIDFAVRNLRRSWERKDDIPRIKTEVDSGLPPVLGNKQGLGTVVQLLLDNALKFSTGDVEIQAHRESSHVRLAILDHGIGIAKDQFEQIFESFYQIDSSETRRYGGAGVGLAIVRLILERHNVKIIVDSQEGVGSTFSFRLPIVDIRNSGWKPR